MAGTYQEMIAKVNELSFVMDEARLFLDTHPTNCEAMSLFKESAKARNEAVKEFTKVYGSLNCYNDFNGTEWKWVDTPWPWEGGRC